MLNWPQIIAELSSKDIRKQFCFAGIDHVSWGQTWIAWYNRGESELLSALVSMWML